MGRRERPLDPSEGPVARFAHELRKLRREAGGITYRAMAAEAHYSAATLAQAAAGDRLPSLPVTLAYAGACGGDREEWERRWHAAAAEAAKAAEEAESGSASPYLGLARFEVDDHERFFGRDRLADRLVELLGRKRLVVVTGPSGSGKSSVLRAGLIARLRGGGLGPAALGAIRILTPGPHPARTHAEVLDPGTAPAGTVVVVDQLEEVFTLCTDRVERAHFLDLLCAAAGSGRDMRVVLAVRADFYGHLAQHRSLTGAAQDATLLVGPMSPEELREAIVKPAARGGLVVERSLTTRIIRDVCDEPGGLPLMSHALLETWRRRSGRVLTEAAYDSAGGIHGAIARTAEDFYGRLTAGQAEAARRILLRLVTPGQGSQDTRRPADREEVTALGPGPAADADLVLDHLARARLVTLEQDTVDLAHEAVLTAWPRLRTWIDDDRDRIRAQRHLTEAAHTWQALGRDPGSLYRGLRLSIAEQHCAAPGQPDDLTPLEREFLIAGRAAEAAERATTRRRMRRMRNLVVLLSLLLTLTTVATIAAVRAQHRADQQRDIATSRRVAEQVRALRSADPALALQLSLAAYRLSPTVEARGSLLSSFSVPYATEVAGHRGDAPVLFSPDGRLLATGRIGGVRLWDATDPRRPSPVGTVAAAPGEPALPEATRAMAFSPDGRLLLTSGRSGGPGDEDRGGVLCLWDVTDPRHPRRLSARRTAVAVSAAFGADGRTLATAGQDGVLRLWSSSRRHGLRPVTGLPRGHATGNGRLTSVAFSPDGRTLAAGSTDRTVHRWDTTRPQRPRQLPALRGHRDAVASVAFSPDGRTLAAGGRDHTIRIWATGRSGVLPAVTLTGHTDRIHHLAFSPDGHTLASGGVEGVRLWTLHGAGRPYQAEHLTGHNGAVTSVAFAPDGSTLVSGSQDGTVRLWDLATDTLAAHSSSVYAVAAAPRGRLLASASYDGTVRLWSTAHPRAVRELSSPAGHTAAVNTLAFTSDGETLISGSLDGTARLWSVTDPRRPRLLATLPAHGAVDAVAVSPDGRTVVTADDEGAWLWDITDPHRPRSGARLPGAAQSLAFAPDGRTLACGDTDGTIRLWAVASSVPQNLGGLRGHTRVVKSLAFRRDGRLLASAGDDRTARLWPLAHGRPTGRSTVLTGHAEPLHAVGFSPDGRTLATAGNDDSVRLWRTAPGQRVPEELATLTGHAGDVNAVAFSPDGRTLATASNDRTVRLWDPEPERVSARVCRTARPVLTRGQWNEHLPETPYRPPCG
ncbi:XRE family transcriptional regulator [Streptomyces sp. NPDC085946]|uniref:nSTAND1 domain-containing NTPase n=1 Tax=Streptomyces sp. NPDC085946 TaxID=3365744 RepID=UPI0037CEC5A0